jgi:cytoplasmic iron level regulating protein YaaA (DUF328/UPF0246 family)
LRQAAAVLAVLLPPSEGKAPGGDGPAWSVDDGRFGEALAESRSAIVNALTKADGGDSQLLGVGGPTLEAAQVANRALVGAPTLPAWQRFTGVVWQQLDICSLRGQASRRAGQSVIVVSALTGLSALRDPVPDHRLKLSASLDPLGKLSTWWRSILSETLNDTLRKRLVIDLLPQEHQAAWTPTPGAYDLRRVQFVGHDGRIAGHTAKAAKGLLARALLQADDPEHALAHWEHPDLRIEVETVR